MGDDLVMALVRVVPLLVAMAASAASAAPTWTTPSTLPFTLQNGPVVGFAAGGVQFLAYLDIEQPLDVNNAVTRLIVTRTPPGAIAAEDLRIESTAAGVPLSVSLAVAPSGAAALLYAEATSNDLSPPPPLRWRAAYRAADGVWESPVTLFTDSLFSLDIATSGAQILLCAIAPDGSAVAGASHVEPDDQPEPVPGQADARLDVALHPANGSWLPAQRLSPANESVVIFAKLAADDGGNFTVAWSARTDEGGTNSTSDDLERLVVRRLLSGQSVWNTTEAVTAQGSFLRPSIAVGPSGNAVATFQQGVQVWAATRVDSLHTFAAPEQLVTTASSSAPLAAGAAPDGTSYVLYGFNAMTSDQTHVGVVKRPPGGAWTDPTPVSPLQFDGRDGAIAFRGNDAILVWTADDANDVNNGTHLIEASRWLAGAEAPEGFRDLEELEQGESLRQVTSDRSGGVLAWWFRGATFRAAAFDAGGPLLAVSGIPASASAGGATTFAATFVDLWSPLGPGPTWDFGDGTPAAVGATVGHAYAAPGSYGGAVRAADALGNETVVPFTVNVGPEAIPPGVAVTLPSCPDRLSSQACERRRRRRKLWQTLRGTASDAAPSSGLAAVEVSVTIVAGKKTLLLNGDRFVRDGDPSAFTPATLAGTSWSLRLPKLRAGRATIVARARDTAGNASETTVEVRLR